MLTQIQANETTRGKKLNDFFTINSTIVASYQPFADEVADFTTNNTQLQKLAPAKQADGKPITVNKTTLKHNVADALAKVCGFTKAYAIKTDNQILQATVNYNADKIFKVKDTDLLPLVTTLVDDTLTPLLTIDKYKPYGVKKAMLDSIKENATTFDGHIGKADATNGTSTVANTNIDDVIKKVQANIKQMDLLVDFFEDDNPDFVQGYHINSATVKTAVRHSGIEGKITDKATGQPIAGATIHLQNTSKTEVSDLLGNYHLERVQTGDYTIEITAKGYTTQTKVHHISRGKIDELDWEM